LSSFNVKYYGRVAFQLQALHAIPQTAGTLVITVLTSSLAIRRVTSGKDTSLDPTFTGIRSGMKTRLEKVDTDWRTFQNNYESNMKNMRVALNHVGATEFDDSEK
jgi:hypothetical protein